LCPGRSTHCFCVLRRPLPRPSLPSFFFSTVRRPPRPTLFPYTTLFRSLRVRSRASGSRDRGRPTPMHSPRSDTARRRVRHPHGRSEEHTSELQSRFDLVCRLLLEKNKRRARPKSDVTTRWLL